MKAWCASIYIYQFFRGRKALIWSICQLKCSSHCSYQAANLSPTQELGRDEQLHMIIKYFHHTDTTGENNLKNRDNHKM